MDQERGNYDGKRERFSSFYLFSFSFSLPRSLKPLFGPFTDVELVTNQGLGKIV